MFRKAKLATKVIASNFGALSRPYKLNFITTKECHSRCVNCHIWKAKPANELTLTEIRTFAKNSPFLSWVNFTGGEPTDRPDFAEVVEAFVTQVPDLALLHFPTNGLKPEHIARTAEKIAKLNPPSLMTTVSIDGPPPVNDRIRGIVGDFENAIETLKRLDRIPRVKAFVGMTLYPSNFRLIAETMAAIQSRVPGFDYSRFHVNLAHRSPHYYGNSVIKRTLDQAMIQSLQDYLKARGPVRSPVDWMEKRFHQLSVDYIRTGRTPLDCSALSTSCFLTESGEVHPCSIWDQSLGNIRDSGLSLLPLISSAQAQDLRAKIAEKKCANCWTPCEAFQTIAANIIPASAPGRNDSNQNDPGEMPDEAPERKKKAA